MILLGVLMKCVGTVARKRKKYTIIVDYVMNAKRVGPAPFSMTSHESD